MSQPPRQRHVYRALSGLIAVVLLVAGFPTSAVSAQVAGDIVISEIFYNPDGQDEGHEFIELHNTTSSPIDVSGWQFLTGITYTFGPGTSIDADSYIVLAQNALDFETVFGFAPTGDFAGTLSNGGENITLVDPANTIIDQVIYDDAAPWPLSPDGDGDSLVSIDASLPPNDSTRWVAGTPTPQVANDPILDVTFSVRRGWYSSSQTVTLTPTVPDATVFYNTSGNGAATTEYTGPITVPNTGVQVIQAQAMRNGEASALSTHTYVFEPDTGAPVVATWPNGLAVAPDEDELTRSFEFIPPPSTGLAPAWANAGVAASAGGIDAGESDKFFFRGVYGNATLSANLFGDNYYGIEPTSNIDQLFLRNNQGDTTHLRQIFAHDALLETGQLSPHGRFVQYYKSGVDSGVRHMQERPEGGFMESYTDVDKDQWLAWSTNEVTPGSGTSNGLGNATLGAPFSSWEDATSSIDPDSLIDYLLVQWQAKVSDYRNIKNFRTAGPADYTQAYNRNEAPFFPIDTERDNYRYHFFNWDMDLGYSNNQYGRGGPTGWGWAGYASPDFLAHELDDFIEFRLLASDRITCAHFDGGALTQQAFAPRLDARRQELIAAGGADESSFVNSLTTWIGQRNTWLLDEYRSPGADRTVYGSFRPDRAPWKPDTSFTGPLLQQDEPVGVSVTNGVLSVTNPNGGQVYYRTDGGDPREADGTLSPAAIAYAGPAGLPAGQVAIIARSFDAGDTDVFQAWSPACNEPDVLDIAVTGNPGASPGEGLVISEIQYNPNPPQLSSTESYLAEFIEITNTTAGTINLSGFRFSAGVDFAFPVGSSLAAGGTMFVIPENAIFASSAVYRFAQDELPVGEYQGRLNDGGETITLIDAVGAVVDTVTYDDAEPWPTEADGEGPSLSLIDLSLDNDLPSSWGPSRSIGTPDAANDVAGAGDADCSDELTIADALVIAQFSVGIRTGSVTCPLEVPATQLYSPAADFDGNGQIDIGDALLVAQCTVGIENGFCPN